MSVYLTSYQNASITADVTFVRLFASVIWRGGRLFEDGTRGFTVAWYTYHRGNLSGIKTLVNPFLFASLGLQLTF